MSDLSVVRIAVGDEVRVHFHPPGLTVSFVEGAVSRTDVETLRGRAFVVDATYEVVLDREQPIRPGYQNYILYDRWDEFPGRIEVLPKFEQEADKEPVFNPAAQDTQQKVQEEPALQPEAVPIPLQAEGERREVHKRGGLIAALFGRQQ